MYRSHTDVSLLLFLPPLPLSLKVKKYNLKKEMARLWSSSKWPAELWDDFLITSYFVEVFPFFFSWATSFPF